MDTRGERERKAERGENGVAVESVVMKREKADISLYENGI